MSWEAMTDLMGQAYNEILVNRGKKLRGWNRKELQNWNEISYTSMGVHMVWVLKVAC